MNLSQQAAYRRLFHALFRDLCQQCDKQPTSDYRHQVAEWILGYHKSSSQWTGKEYSIVVDQLKEWLAGQVEPHALDQNTRNRRDYDETQKQLIWKIEHTARAAGLYEDYIQAVADETLRAARRPWRDHGTVALKHLRSTITARAHSKLKNKATHA